MTNVLNSEFTAYVNYLKNKGLGSAYNVAFNHTTISVNLEGLKDNMAQYNAAKNALGLLSKFSGLSFVLTTSSTADIMTDNRDSSGAYATRYTSGNTITKSNVNVATNWVSDWSIGEYGVQTFIHEFGHALGLNHGGPYNGNGSYDTDAIFNIDTWQYSIMSYFTQDNYDNASYLYLLGPMIGDIKALNDLYGRLAVNTGNTVYGRGETVYSGWTDFGRYSQSTYCVNDTGGIDLLDYSNTYTNNLIDLRAGYFSNVNGYKGNVSISLGTVIENAYGGSGNDTIMGNAVGNVLRGNAGADTLYGFAGNDALRGGDGNDALVGGLGADLHDGGAGIDTAYYSDSTVGLRVSLLSPSTNTGIAAGDTYISVENIYGSGYNDTLIGDNFANTLWGANGNDYLYGNGGNDALNGGAGSDYLVGGDGNDALVGGAGLDRLFGGSGADSFVFTLTSDSTASSTGRDIIYDFSFAQGDRIDLRLIDANTRVAGNQAFTYIGTAAFTGVAGQLHVVMSGGNTYVFADVNGDRIADFAITISGVNALSSLNYYL